MNSLTPFYHFRMSDSLRERRIAAGLLAGLAGLTLSCLLLFISPSPVSADTFITNCNDDVQLRAALVVGGNVTFACSGTITVTTPLTVTSNTYINGGGVTLSGGNSSQVMTVKTGVALTLDDLTIRNGNAGGQPGGGVYNNGILVVSNTFFISNTASLGGGIYSSQALTLTNVQVISNTSGSDGGGVYAAGPIVVTGGRFESNRCTGGGCNGGGLQTGGTLTLNGTQFIGNQANTNGGGANVSGTATLTGGRFENNSVINSRGGGLYISSRLEATGTQVISNSAYNAAGGVWATGAVTLTNVYFARNHSEYNVNGGGGLFSFSPVLLINTQFVSNTTTGNGAGVFVLSGITLSGGRFEQNQAGGQGGGLSTDGTLAMTNTEFISNTAASGGGGYAADAAVLSSGQFKNNRAITGLGGGFVANNTLTLSGTQFISNTAQISGGGAYAIGAVTLTGGSFDLNRSMTGGGGGLYADSAITMTGARFISNTSVLGGGVYVNGTASVQNSAFVSNTVSSFGGGLLMNGPGSTITNTTFSSNSADNGGGVYNSGGANNSILNSTFWGNQANSSGGNLGLVLRVKNTLVANGTPNNCSAPVTSLGHNLDSGNTCGLNGMGDKINTNSLLGPLQNNGGNTLTHALLSDSPAIDAGDDAGCPPGDQRGVPRPEGAHCDIGAFEFGMFVYLPLIRR